MNSRKGRALFGRILDGIAVSTAIMTFLNILILGYWFLGTVFLPEDLSNLVRLLLGIVSIWVVFCFFLVVFVLKQSVFEILPPRIHRYWVLLGFGLVLFFQACIYTNPFGEEVVIPGLMAMVGILIAVLGVRDLPERETRPL